MRPTAYQIWLYKVSNGDFEVLKHLIKQELIDGKESTFDLFEESEVFTFDDESVNKVTNYLINKICQQK
jgi:hypothetical protein